MWQMKIEICFNVNQSFRTIHRIVTYSTSLIFSIFFHRQKRSENFKVLLQQGENLLEICSQMNKAIRFNINRYLRTMLHRTVTYSMLVYFIYVLYYLLGREKNPKILRCFFRKKEIIEHFLAR